jgi:hypothetical protein
MGHAFSFDNPQGLVGYIAGTDFPRISIQVNTPCSSSPS